MALIIDEPDFVAIREQLQFDEPRGNIHIAAYAVKQHADRLVGSIVDIGKELLKRQDQSATSENIEAELVGKPMQTILDPGFGARINGTAWAKPSEHERHAGLDARVEGRLHILIERSLIPSKAGFRRRVKFR